MLRMVAFFQLMVCASENDWLHRLCSKITDSLINHGMLCQDLSEWCIYWIQKRIITYAVILGMFLLGSQVFGAGVTLSYLFGLLPLRRRLFGYHTKSPYTCAALSIAIMFFALSIHRFFPQVSSIRFIGINWLLSFVLITYFLKDQNDLRLHLTKEEMKVSSKLAFRVFCNVSIASAAIALLLDSIECASACQLGISTVVGSSVYSRWKNRGEEM